MGGRVSFFLFQGRRPGERQLRRYEGYEEPGIRGYGAHEMMGEQHYGRKESHRNIDSIVFHLVLCSEHRSDGYEDVTGGAIPSVVPLAAQTAPVPG